MILPVERGIFMWVLGIIGHILLDFMEIFQVGGFPNLEYQVIQVIWCVSTLIR